VGHSDGGTIALIQAAERPVARQAVVSEAAHVFVEEETITDINDACRAFNAGKMQGLNRCHGNKTGTVLNDWTQTWSSG
jgi:esterase/lipase